MLVVGWQLVATRINKTFHQFSILIRQTHQTLLDKVSIHKLCVILFLKQSPTLVIVKQNGEWRLSQHWSHPASQLLMTPPLFIGKTILGSKLLGMAVTCVAVGYSVAVCDTCVPRILATGSTGGDL